MRRYLSVLVSILFLFVIYWKIDLQALIAVLQTSDLKRLAWAMAIIVLIPPLQALRLISLVPPSDRFYFKEALSLVLVAGLFNMILPSKAGDFIKGYFMKEKGLLGGGASLAIVFVEKLCEFIGLLVVCLIGVLIVPTLIFPRWALLTVVSLALAGCISALVCRPLVGGLLNTGERNLPASFKKHIRSISFSWNNIHAYFIEHKGESVRVLAMSLFISLIQLFQVWLFLPGLHAQVPLFAVLALMPLAILAGFIPFTFAGVGTRDAAIILLFSQYLDTATAAALGILCTLRFFLLALAGVPVVGSYMSSIKRWDLSSKTQ